MILKEISIDEFKRVRRNTKYGKIQRIVLDFIESDAEVALVEVGDKEYNGTNLATTINASIATLNLQNTVKAVTRCGNAYVYRVDKVEL